MPRLHSYVVEHDYGFAPNPFWGWCSLANCKPKIRLKAEIGDFVMGTGSAGASLARHLVYWMRVEEVMGFDEYWADERFRPKRPVLNGSRMQRFGDNIYHTDEQGSIHQLDSFHSEEGGKVSEGNLRRDTGTTTRVLVGRDFAYFGSRAPFIPKELGFVVKKGPGHKNKFGDEEVSRVTEWLQGMPSRGLCGQPIRW